MNLVKSLYLVLLVNFNISMDSVNSFEEIASDVAIEVTVYCNMAFTVAVVASNEQGI